MKVSWSVRPSTQQKINTIFTQIKNQQSLIQRKSLGGIEATISFMQSMTGNQWQTQNRNREISHPKLWMDRHLKTILSGRCSPQLEPMITVLQFFQNGTSDSLRIYKTDQVFWTRWIPELPTLLRLIITHATKMQLKLHKRILFKSSETWRKSLKIMREKKQFVQKTCQRKCWQRQRVKSLPIFWK